MPLLRFSLVALLYVTRRGLIPYITPSLSPPFKNQRIPLQSNFLKIKFTILFSSYPKSNLFEELDFLFVGRLFPCNFVFYTAYVLGAFEIRKQLCLYVCVN
jgi:hypothetical protein